MSSEPTDGPDSADRPISRRRLLAGAAGLAGAGLVKTARDALSQEPADGESQARDDGGDPTKRMGRVPSERGERSPHERPRRLVGRSRPSGESRTPIHELRGIVTPSDIHFERHHAGIPDIDPQEWKLLVHGMVERPRTYDLEDIKRFPAVSRLCFIECSGNGYPAYFDQTIRPDLTPAEIDGLTSTSEWVGVPLSTLFREVGVRDGARWFVAEAMDGAVMTRSIPVEKGWDDALIAYGQNGEAIRPAQGYPARLLLPGWEGNAQVKWIRRIEISDRPFMTREETSKYSDPLPDCTARLFSFVMDAKSIITFPAYPAVLPETGWWEIRGLAWSGRGRIERVEVSADGGRTWEPARLEEPVLPKCHTRFRHLWRWDGGEAVLMSRAVDETGYVQPDLETLRRVRGEGTFYHHNNIRAWKVGRDGAVRFGLEAPG